MRATIKDAMSVVGQLHVVFFFEGGGHLAVSMLSGSYYYLQILICPYVSTISFFVFKTHSCLVQMHQNFVCCLWAPITAAILLGILSERDLS